MSSTLPQDLFIGSPPEPRRNRPIGQGDVFANVPVAGMTATRNGKLMLQAKPAALVIVVASSCGMRKQAEGELNDVIHVAPIKKLSSLAPNWSGPESYLDVLPLPGLLTPDGQDAAANLGRTGLCGTNTLDVNQRVACLSKTGMQVLKARIATYFVRAQIPVSLIEVGAHKEWHELDLWERWANETGSLDGFQAWMSEENPNFPPLTRRETIYDDLGGIEIQLAEKLGIGTD